VPRGGGVETGGVRGRRYQPSGSIAGRAKEVAGATRDLILVVAHHIRCAAAVARGDRSREELLKIFVKNVPAPVAMLYAAIPSSLVWSLQVGAIAASILVSGGFFAVAHARSLRIVLYTGAVLVAATTLTVGVGLIRSR